METRDADYVGLVAAVVPIYCLQRLDAVCFDCCFPFRIWRVAAPFLICLPASLLVSCSWQFVGGQYRYCYSSPRTRVSHCLSFFRRLRRRCRSSSSLRTCSDHPWAIYFNFLERSGLRVNHVRYVFYFYFYFFGLDQGVLRPIASTECGHIFGIEPRILTIVLIKCGVIVRVARSRQDQIGF